MLRMIPADEIETRAKAIGLSMKRLARLAGMAASTPYRVRERGSANTKTLRKLSDALMAEEARVAAHLAKLTDRAA
jgi:predicted transcriptional regulator